MRNGLIVAIALAAMSAASVWAQPSSGPKPSLVLDGSSERLHIAMWSPDGALVVTLDFLGDTRIWDARTGRLLRVLDGHFLSESPSPFRPDGVFLITSSVLGVHVWNLENGEEIGPISRPGRRARTGLIGFGPDGQLIYLSAGEDAVRIVGPDDVDRRVVLRISQGRIYDVAISPDGARVLIGSGLPGDRSEEQVELFDGRTGDRLMTYSSGANILATAFSASGDVFMIDRVAETTLYDAAAGTERSVVESSVLRSLPAALSPDGQRLALVEHGVGIGVWDVAAGERTATLGEGRVIYGSCAFGPDGTRILSTGPSDVISVWNIENGVETFRLEGVGEIQSVSFSPNGERILVNADGHPVRVWDYEPSE